MSPMETFFFSSFIAIELDKGYCELKVFRLIFLLGFASIVFLITGCNDTPNSVGKKTLDNNDFGVVHVDTFYATDHLSTQNLIFTSSMDRFMLGRYKTYEAWTCIKFFDWPDSLIGAKITGATILLKGVYHFGDSLAPLSFHAYRAVSNLFLSDSLIYDSLSLNSVNSVHGVYYNSSPLSIQTFIPIGDTGSTTISILDTTMLREWFSTNTDTTDLNDGLIFRPTNSNIIKGFYSFNAPDTSYQPVLYVTYEDTNGNTLSYSHKFGYSKYVSTVNPSALMTDTKLMYVQNGISYRGLVSFDSISTPWPVSVYRAVLQVTLNAPQSSAQFTPFAHDSVYALSVGSDNKSDGGAYGLSQLSIDSSGHSMYSFEIRDLAVRVLNKASVRKVSLSGYSESGSFDLHSFYGAPADTKLKPRLIITYSIQH
jgi:hypothetical protein